MGEWAERASSLYDHHYARRYRAHDDDYVGGEVSRHLTDWLRDVSTLFAPPIDVLDLGCGTGRYFWALRGVGTLVGIDASPAMLAEARRPVHGDLLSAPVTLIEGDLVNHEFDAGRFDLVYSIGVLAEHVPLDQRVVQRVARWLKPGGRFAFTTVHPDSPTVPRTWRRRLGAAVMPLAPEAVRDRLRLRLLAGGRYADEARIVTLMAPAFEIESLVRFQSEAHLHCRCLARRRPA